MNQRQNSPELPSGKEEVKKDVDTSLSAVEGEAKGGNVFSSAKKKDDYEYETFSLEENASDSEDQVEEEPSTTKLKTSHFARKTESSAKRKCSCLDAEIDAAAAPSTDAKKQATC